MFSTANPLHPDAWPSVCRMESEVVAMTASMLGGDSSSTSSSARANSVCGCMTSGGTESILLAMKAYRDYASSRRWRWRGSSRARPEVVLAPTAHAAYWKAAEYFGLRLVLVPVSKDMRLSGASVRRALSRNTVAVVASAPSYPHGVVDDVAGIAAVARAGGVPLHVDACLGGFVLPFARKLGWPVPPFDFDVPGVTSMSVDTHKFGQAHKGTSVLLWASPSLRRHQYTRITDWSGGLYISPSMAGT